MSKETEAIQRIMNGLKCSEAEAKEIYEYDRSIDKGEKTEYDLSAEQQKVAKQYTRTGTRKQPTVYKFDKKERKANPTKGGIIAELYEFLSKNSEFAIENAEITNKERQIAFQVGENRFELTLIQKRTPKS